MGDTSATSSSTSSTKSNSTTSTIKKRTIADAGLDEDVENEKQNHEKRVVVFEAFKLYDVQSAVCIRIENRKQRPIESFLGQNC